jgi:hypothetical protein
MSAMGQKRTLTLRRSRVRFPLKADIRYRCQCRLCARSALSGREVASGDLVFMGGEGCQDFALLALRDLGEIQAPSQFRGDLIEFGWRDHSGNRMSAFRGKRTLERPSVNVRF